MVRKVRLAHDDGFAGLEPDSRRPAFDDLDDFLLDGPDDKTLRRPRDGAGRRQSPKPPRASRPDVRRHLADADWTTDRTP